MKKVGRKIHDELELNLAPMMDLFVSLLPFLILSASFVQLGGVDAKGPAAADQVSKVAAKDQDDLWLSVNMDSKKIFISGHRKDFDRTVEGVKAEFTHEQLPELQAYLDSLIAKNYKMGPSLFHAGSDARYDQVMACLSTMRSSKAVQEIVIAAGVVE